MINIAALKTEIQTDPLGLGYAAFLPLTDAKPILALLNSVPPGATATLAVAEVSARDIVNSVVQSEIPSFTADQKQMISWIIAAGGVSLDKFTQVSTLF